MTKEQDESNARYTCNQCSGGGTVTVKDEKGRNVEKTCPNCNGTGYIGKG